jgi:hypothetical protein
MTVDNTFDSMVSLLQSWHEEIDAIREMADELEVRADELGSALFGYASGENEGDSSFDDEAAAFAAPPATPYSDGTAGNYNQESADKTVIWGTGPAKARNSVSRITVTTASGDTVVWGN